MEMVSKQARGLLGSGQPAYGLTESGIVFQSKPPTEDDVDLLFAKTKYPI